jgi:hypothetical protein
MKESDTVQSKPRGTPAGDDVMTVEERLERLEKRLRRGRFTSLMLWLAVGGLSGGLAFEHFGVHSLVRARRLEIVNDKAAAIELTTSVDGDGMMNLRDGMQLPRVTLGTSQKGNGLIELYTGSKQKLVSVGGTGSGGQVAVYNVSGSKVVDMQAIKTNCGAIVVNDYDGRFVQGFTGDVR